ncbi:hypothetical protein Dsin_010191 [Dipteronia sinensis]|uniref:Uncharacterized protein n=1 Tax=Dipteronia sinensis TaxID=43782 RepID=A0AAE0ARY7_9ROSI|nr:hypothetical protein Dsin_010191 [Dipteronia sinensis]
MFREERVQPRLVVVVGVLCKRRKSVMSKQTSFRRASQIHKRLHRRELPQIGRTMEHSQARLTMPLGRITRSRIICRIKIVQLQRLLFTIIKTEKPSPLVALMGQTGTLNKVIANSETESRKTGSTKNDTGKELSSSRAKNLTQKKQSMNGDSQSEENNNANVLNKKDERSIKCNVAVDGCMNWSKDNRKKGMDIVSFTFSSPIRSMTNPQVLRSSHEKN